MEISAMPDAVLRNLRITQSYHELAAAYGAVSGEMVSWPAFAVWASRQAGQTIRGEDLFAAIRLRFCRRGSLFRHPVEWVWRRLIRAGLLNPLTRLGRIVHKVQGPLDVVERTSAAVAEGNLKVFREIGAVFAEFIRECGEDEAFDEEKLKRVCGKLRAGDPPDGQGYLQNAIRRYYLAMFEADASARLRLMFHANAEIGFHEQLRLQDEIVAALDAPVTEVRETGQQILSVLAPGSRNWRGWARGSCARVLGVVAGGGVRFGRKEIRGLITECLMTMRLPDGAVLLLGRDVPGEYPDTLRELDDPELVAVLEKIGSVAQGREKSAADDWSDFRSRMRYIVHLFRVHAADVSFLKVPFGAREAEMIRAGVVPEGEI